MENKRSKLSEAEDFLQKLINEYGIEEKFLKYPLYLCSDLDKRYSIRMSLSQYKEASKKTYGEWIRTLKNEGFDIPDEYSKEYEKARIKRLLIKIFAKYKVNEPDTKAEEFFEIIKDSGNDSYK